MAAIQQNSPTPSEEIMNFGTDGPVLLHNALTQIFHLLILYKIFIYNRDNAF
jgi:hypothetical protein